MKNLDEQDSSAQNTLTQEVEPFVQRYDLKMCEDNLLPPYMAEFIVT